MGRPRAHIVPLLHLAALFAAHAVHPDVALDLALALIADLVALRLLLLVSPVRCNAPEAKGRMNVSKNQKGGLGMAGGASGARTCAERHLPRRPTTAWPSHPHCRDFKRIPGGLVSFAALVIGRLSARRCVPLFTGALCEQAQLLFLGLLLLLSELLLDGRTLGDLLARLPVGNVQGLGQLGKVVADRCLIIRSRPIGPTQRAVSVHIHSHTNTNTHTARGVGFCAHTQA